MGHLKLLNSFAQSTPVWKNPLITTEMEIKSKTNSQLSPDKQCWYNLSSPYKHVWHLVWRLVHGKLFHTSHLLFGFVPRDLSGSATAVVTRRDTAKIARRPDVLIFAA